MRLYLSRLFAVFAAPAPAVAAAVVAVLLLTMPVTCGILVNRLGALSVWTAHRKCCP